MAHGWTWRYLGTYPFYTDQPARVSLTNASDVPDRIVSAGAVRIGGGTGSELGEGEPPSPGTSGRPRWEEAARYWVKFQGAPPSVYHPSINDRFDDVTARSRYAEWEKPPDGKSRTPLPPLNPPQRGGSLFSPLWGELEGG